MRWIANMGNAGAKLSLQASDSGANTMNTLLMSENLICLCKKVLGKHIHARPTQKNLQIRLFQEVAPGADPSPKAVMRSLKCSVYLRFQHPTVVGELVLMQDFHLRVSALAAK
jgi:hypothetical protein